MQEYDRICDWYVSMRRPQVGVSISEFVRPLAPGSRILDIGCGHGIPISKFFVESGLELFAIDSSPNLIARFQSAFPRVRVQCSRIQDSDFFNIPFDAIVAWGVIFYMTPADQENVIARVSRSLKTGGKFLFASPRGAITWEDTMDGVIFHSVSLGTSTYSKLLQSNGLDLLEERFDEWENYYYIAQKAA